MLETVALTRSFGGIRAVDSVSLEVAPGEILGLIGPNGAGKTTLFDLIAGFTAEDTGHVLLDGRDVTTLSPHMRARRGLGRSFQDARLFPSLTVEEAMAVALELEVEVKSAIAAMLYLPNVHDSEEKVRLRVDELIELLGLQSFRSKFLRELSTGSRRIVDLACVVAHNPKVVLLDEPSSGIAQRETEALVPVLLRIREQLGASILVIEHDMPLISGIADRILALDQGAVIASGSSEEVLHHPGVIASYLGTNKDVIARSGERQS
ncbi:MAG: ABC-type branched-subunit amino acid transport system ATPase component [Candidatus Aldehydirespiratoraceae bacterium]|jgi:ABC-type branched-subunit amino acid transport system ATPase component